MIDRLQFLSLKRKDIIATLNEPDLSESERAEYQEALDQVNKDMAAERIVRLKGTS